MSILDPDLNPDFTNTQKFLSTVNNYIGITSSGLRIRGIFVRIRILQIRILKTDPDPDPGSGSYL